MRLDGNDQGNLTALGHSLLVKRPDQKHTVQLSCPDREPIEKAFQTIWPPYNEFKDPA